jgi:hypothetical protein
VEVDKPSLLRGFREEAAGLRKAAAALDVLLPVESGWGPREVLAHIALWAVQAAEHFRLHLPPQDYGNGRIWRTAMFGTFNTAFEYLSDQSAEAARRSGWEAVARAGVVLPLTTEDTPDKHLRVDDAFNAAAVELVRGRPFQDVLRLTERAHERLLRVLEEAPSEEYANDGQLYLRLLRIIQHHAGHRRHLERQVVGVSAPVRDLLETDPSSAPGTAGGRTTSNLASRPPCAPGRGPI